ncbi:MAG: hypothetical protein JNJ73_20875 [Hyphomonadaceae bacterium]|nr:hypothetical protein [Hyphomonadaceae bacterium]
MIRHLSFAAAEPKRVADALAEIMGGFVIPFPPNPGAYMAIARDAHGTGVEVHPADTVLDPREEARFQQARAGTPYSAVHFALSVAADAETIAAVAAREGWRCQRLARGGDFGVIELWVENRFLVELMTPVETAEYLAFTAQFADAAKGRDLMASHAPG